MRLREELNLLILLEIALLFFLQLDQASSYQDPHNPSQSQLRSFSGAQSLDLFGQESHLVAILSFQVLRRIFRRGYVLTYWNVFQHAAKQVSIPSRRIKVLL